MSGRPQRALVQPITVIFKMLQQRRPCQVWLVEQTHMKIEGTIVGFDEFMNLVLENAEEVMIKTKARKKLGRILLKGDNIVMLSPA
ncbi:hypothetical protein CXG81DRAFT_13632 [Caulochytrium protostelioides]|uniref:Small nuclear ribonucleoprotein E n=1 Tax=Caulochytrium protostelioides TaxID=1555241 RepID=A0A4P9X4S6_9FUNG|nr:LSM-domain-containing protein [Caulochytrium protostelioides]RKP00098.1 hypothetical protein CXG81DRAFT_13632 [Caulochytrium protostelioides]|eukprot:RKP00098.1 hypothetical protein CXG81DRAFT_13632 [Caulochytrium protostelioides]